MAGYSIEKKLIDAFIITAKVKGEKMSDIVECAIIDYVIKNKAEVNELIKNEGLKLIDL